MKTLTGKLLAMVVPFVVLSACGPSWKVVKQANPNPLQGKRTFVVEEIKFDNLMIGKKAEADYIAGKEQKWLDSYNADKSAMVNGYTGRLIALKGGYDIAPSTGAAPADGFIIRPVISWLEPGNFNGVFNIASEAKLRLQVVDGAGTVVDEVELHTAVPADIVRPSVGQRYRIAADQLGSITMQYLGTRTK
jgi:hypothetical protein